MCLLNSTSGTGTECNRDHKAACIKLIHKQCKLMPPALKARNDSMAQQGRSLAAISIYPANHKIQVGMRLCNSFKASRNCSTIKAASISSAKPFTASHIQQANHAPTMLTKSTPCRLLKTQGTCPVFCGKPHKAQLHNRCKLWGS